MAQSNKKNKRTSDNNDVIILSDSGDEDDLNFWNISESNKKKKIEVGGDDSDDLSHLLEIEEDNDAMLNVPIAGGASESRDGVEKRFTVLSWNIDGLEESCFYERLLGTIKEINDRLPDVVLLQEVVDEACVNLVLHLSKLYEIYKHSGGGYFNIMMVRKKPSLVSIGYLDGSKFPGTEMDRHYLLQKLKICGHPVTFITTHLESLKDHAKERQRQLKQCFDLVNTNQSIDKANVIFAGDLNMRAEDLKKVGGIPSGVTDAWETTGENPDTKFTWDLELNDNKVFPNCKPRARFDRMYFKRAQSGATIQCIDFVLVGVERLVCGMFPSDHFGILATFVFSE